MITVHQGIFIPRHMIELLWIPLSQLPEIDLRAEPLKQLVPKWLKTASVDVFKSEMTTIPPL